jgi:hypothetical protein
MKIGSTGVKLFFLGTDDRLSAGLETNLEKDWSLAQV